MKIGISAQYKQELEWVIRSIHDITKNIEFFLFEEIDDPAVLKDLKFFLIVGGDGSVAWFLKAFFDKFGSLGMVPPLVPVVRPQSIGYLRQLDMSSAESFKVGFNEILKGQGKIIKRTILITEFNNKKFVGVNDIALFSQPHLSEFTIVLDGIPLSKLRGDGLMVVTSLGSTAWGLSHHGAISVDEENLQIIGVGGLSGTPNYVIPRQTLSISCKLKNPVIVDTTIEAYQQARDRASLPPDEHPNETLLTIFETRLVVDGKICGFSVTKIEIDSSHQIPFLSISDELPIVKASKLTDIFQKKQNDP